MRKSAPVSVGQVIPLNIERLSYNGGRGVGRFEGFVVFTPFTAPEDRILARITEVKKSHALAELVEIQTPGPARRTPPCEVFGTCGGCSWQHIEYQEQARQKQSILEQSLRPLQAFSDFKFLPMVLAPSEFHYRNRIQVHIEGDQWGFHQKGSNRIVPLNNCLISEPEIAQALKSLPQNLRQTTKAQKRIEILKDPKGEMHLVDGERPANLHVFSQVNTRQNEGLKDLLCKLLAGSKLRRIFDLYCGNGNFSFPIAEIQKEAEIFGADLSESNIQQARRRAEQMGEDRFHFVTQDVGHFLQAYRGEKPDAILIDPPRPGCEARVISEVLSLRPQKLVYISCNPSTFARDAGKILASGLYQITSVQGIDMFPQTEHVELISSFELLPS